MLPNLETTNENDDSHNISEFLKNVLPMDINIFRDPDSEIFDTDISYFYFKLS
jgi:hypothetical protein